MDPRIEFPYYSPEVPAPLPTLAEIEAGENLIEHNAFKVSRVGSHFIVKWGDARQLDLMEGENMVFVHQVTKGKVKVPKVYAMYTKILPSVDGDFPHNFIVMQQIEGSTLRDLYPSLTQSEKESISSTLKGYFDELRRIPAPGYYGSIGKRHLLSGVFWTPKPTAQINGPFESEEDLNEAMALKYKQESQYRSEFKQQFYRRSLNTVFRNHPPTFTHGDFQRKNILVRKLGNRPGAECKESVEGEDAVFEVTLIDWANSGWLPSYWEYSSSMIGDIFQDDWSQWISNILSPYYSEYPWYRMVYLELWS